jgi:hypothetical protein
MIMSPDDWYIDGCTKASPHYQKLFYEWTAHLPKRDDSTPYHSGAHSIKHFEHALAIAGLSRSTPFNVVEIGFCLGHSAEIFLRLGAEHVSSVEISDRPQTIQARDSMIKKWPGRFQFIRPFEADKCYGFCDFGFIDGDHGRDSIRRDVEFMRQRRAGWVLFDDFWPHWGETQIVMQEQSLCPIAILGTMALCQFA